MSKIELTPRTLVAGNIIKINSDVSLKVVESVIHCEKDGYTITLDTIKTPKAIENPFSSKKIFSSGVEFCKNLFNSSEEQTQSKEQQSLLSRIEHLEYRVDRTEQRIRTLAVELKGKEVSLFSSDGVTSGKHIPKYEPQDFENGSDVRVVTMDKSSPLDGKIKKDDPKIPDWLIDSLEKKPETTKSTDLEPTKPLDQEKTKEQFDKLATENISKRETLENKYGKDLIRAFNILYSDENRCKSQAALGKYSRVETLDTYNANKFCDRANDILTHEYNWDTPYYTIQDLYEELKDEVNK